MFRLTRNEERTLVRAAQRGDSRALRRLVEFLSGPIYRFGRSFCGNTEDAEDVRQLVFLALLRTLKGFRGDASLSTWAYTVARNACARRHRRAARGPRFESLDGAVKGRAPALQVPDASQDPERSFERSRLGDAIGAALRSLPPAQREVMLLRDVEGLSAREAGSVLGLTERAVKSRLHRARVALRASLAPFAAEHSTSGCPDTARLLSRHLEGELDAKTCQRIASHVTDCPSCGEACESLHAALRACGDLRDNDVTPEMRSAFRVALREALGERSA